MQGAGLTHQKQLGLQCLVRGHSDIWTRGTGDRTASPTISGRPPQSPTFNKTNQHGSWVFHRLPHNTSLFSLSPLNRLCHAALYPSSSCQVVPLCTFCYKTIVTSFDSSTDLGSDTDQLNVSIGRIPKRLKHT